MSKITAAIQGLDLLIRRGQGGVAAEQIRALAGKTLTRAERLSLVMVSYRVGEAALGLRLLHSLIRPGPGLPVKANEAEKAAYAVCLERVGAIEESEALLRTVDGEKVPVALFFRSLVAIARWDYAAAVPSLIEYLRTPRLGEYPRLVAKMNLAACFAETSRLPEATQLTRELLYRTSLRKLNLLHGNALELYAQICFRRQNWVAARRCLDRAQGEIEKAGSMDLLWVKKWRAAVALFAEGGTAAARKQMEEVKSLARQNRSWEGLRDAEAHEAVALGNTHEFWKVYFGTPFPAYRRKLLARFPNVGEPPETFVWRGMPGPDFRIDLKTAAVSRKNVQLKPGQLMHRMLLALTKDFYRPVRNASLFSLLYAGEYYNPASAPARIYEAVRRLRSWIDEYQIPLSLEEKDGAYRLLLGAGAALTLTREHPIETLALSPAERLQGQWPDLPFSSADAAAWLGISKRSAQRLLEELVGESRLIRSGKARLSRYIFIK